MTGDATRARPRRRRDPEPRLDRSRRHAAAGLRRRAAARARSIQCSLDQYVHNGWNMDYQALPPTDLSILAPPDALVAALWSQRSARARRNRARGSRAAERGRRAVEHRGADIGERRAAPPARRCWRAASRRHARAASAFVPPPAARLAGRVLPLRASAGLHRLRRRRRHRLGPGHGGRRGARAARRADRLPVAVLGDGDYLMGLTALWTGVHYRVPRAHRRRQQRIVLQRRAASGAHGAAARPARRESLDRLADERSGDGSRRDSRAARAPRATVRCAPRPISTRRSRKASPTCARARSP